MENLIIIDPAIQAAVTDQINRRPGGKYRAILKCRAGFMVIRDIPEHQAKWFNERPGAILDQWKKGVLQTVEYCHPGQEGNEYWLPVFAKKGNRVIVIDQAILADLRVGTINSTWSGTDLYNHMQYSAVGAKTWACKAFVKNEESKSALEKLWDETPGPVGTFFDPEIDAALDGVSLNTEEQFVILERGSSADNA